MSQVSKISSQFFNYFCTRYQVRLRKITRRNGVTVFLAEGGKAHKCDDVGGSVCSYLERLG